MTRAIVAGVERPAVHRGYNMIACDRCGATQTLERAGEREVLQEARARGWVCDGVPRVDLCPLCIARSA